MSKIAQEMGVSNQPEKTKTGSVEYAIMELDTDTQLAAKIMAYTASWPEAS